MGIEHSRTCNRLKPGLRALSSVALAVVCCATLLLGQPTLHGAESTNRPRFFVGRIANRIPGKIDLTAPPLTNAQQVVELGVEGVMKKSQRVRFQGVVTYVAVGFHNWIYAQDDTAGVLIIHTNIDGQPKEGRMVDVEGLTGAGWFHSFIDAATVRVGGDAPMPTPKETSAPQLAEGADFGHWCRLRAVVHDIALFRTNQLFLQVSSDGRRFDVHMTVDPNEPLPGYLINAEVDMRGVVWTVTDAMNRPIGFRLHVPDTNFLQVVRVGSPDAFACPSVTARQLAAPIQNLDARVSMRGLVTFLSPEGWLVLQDETGPVRVSSRVAFVAADPPAGVSNTVLQPVLQSMGHRAFRCLPRNGSLLVRPGDRVEVTGIPAKQNEEVLAPELIHAELRTLGQGTPPTPRDISIGDAMSGRFDATVVRLKARVVDRETHSQGKTFQHTVWLQAGGTFFEALLVSDQGPLGFAPNTFVEATGLCTVRVGEMRQARSFRLHLADRAALRVLKEPPPWLSAVALRIGGAASGVLALVLGWVWMLRRQVARRTADLHASKQRLEEEARERARAEAARAAGETRLFKSEDRFKKAFKCSPASLAILSFPEARYVEINDGFIETYGWPREQVVGRTSLELGLWADLPLRERLHQKLRDTGGYYNEETLLKRNTGEPITVIQSAELIDLDGRTCILVSSLDISARKRIEAELLRTLERERELGELKTNFVSMVSHEFRTPLEVIVSSADILDRYLDRLKPEQRARHLHAIQSSVKRMAGMMEDVLLLGRFEAGRLEFKPDDLLLPAWCRRLVDEMHSATGRTCPIQLDIAEFPTLVRADESLLRHILTNLLSNAVKYSPPGAPVRFDVGRDNGHVVFRVADRGIGIPVTDQPRLFEAFYRGRNTDSKPGTGLGLVIVKRCVELHGGRIEFSSDEGQGATFTVRLPLLAQAD